MSDSLLFCQNPGYQELTDHPADFASIHAEQKTSSLFRRFVMKVRLTIVFVSLFAIPLLAIVWDKIPHSWNNIAVALNTSLEDGHFVTWQAPVAVTDAPIQVSPDWGTPSNSSFQIPGIPNNETDSDHHQSLAFAPQNHSYANSKDSTAQHFNSSEHQENALNQGTEMLAKGQLNELTKLGITHYELTPWGNSGALWRFSCRAPSPAGLGYEQLFEAVDVSPEKTVGLVIDKINAWQSESRSFR